MRVVALISGGKDSCFNMMHCIANGHEIVALANLKPVEKDEIDSYMFQTVGHDVIELYAEALGLPLFCQSIIGSSVSTDIMYAKDDRDEVEDLYKLLKGIKKEIDYDAVSSGAILSNYQRLRVENVCRRLSLKSVSYLWQRKQEELLDEMILSNLDAILVKVAALGLKPEKHLGKRLQEIAPYLHEMKLKYELNVCGEGGEYETITLDCPLFLKKIVIEEKDIVIHSNDAFAPVGYLVFKKMHLEDKGIDVNTTLMQRMVGCNLKIPNLFSSGILEYVPTCKLLNEEKRLEIESELQLDQSDLCEPNIFQHNGKTWLTELICIQDANSSVEESTFKAMESLIALIKRNGCSMDNVSLVHIFCSSMDNFLKINSVYKTFFENIPPARVCVELPLPSSIVFKMDICVHEVEGNTREALHVESISYWAPANIGPYSQAVKVGNEVFFSGSIGMNPSNLLVIDDGFEKEASLSLSHVDEISRIIAVNRRSYNDYGMVVSYITNQSKSKSVLEVFKCQEMFDSSRYILIVVAVPRLPKNAQVEWHVVSRWEEEASGDTLICGDETFKFNLNFFKLTIFSLELKNEGSFSGVLSKLFIQYSSVLKKAEFVRIFYLYNIAEICSSYSKNSFHESFNKVFKISPAISFVPVSRLRDGEVILVTGSTS